MVKSGRYASYWNAFLFGNKFTLPDVTDVKKVAMYGDSKKSSRGRLSQRDRPAAVVGSGGVRIYPPPQNDRGAASRRRYLLADNKIRYSNEYHQITVIRKYAFRR